MTEAAVGLLAGMVGALAMTAFIRGAGLLVGGGAAARFNAAADAERWASRWRTPEGSAPAQEATPPDTPEHRAGEPPTEAAARWLHTEVTGREPSPRSRARLGTVAHLALGAGSGAIYGLVRGDRGRPPDLVAGLLFGVAVWALADQLMVPLLGLGEPADEEGPAEHALGIGAHLVYGSATAVVVAALHRARERAG